MDQDSDVAQLVNTTRVSTTYKHKWTLYLVFCNFSAVIGSAFVFGYAGVMVNEPFQIFEQFINDSFTAQHEGSFITASSLDTLWTLTVSLFLVGGIFGGLAGGPQANYMGRKRALMFDSIIGVIGGGLQFIAPYVGNFEMLMIGRFVLGVHCGLVSGIVPVFVTELAPLSLRGASGTINQLSICCGGVTASILGLPIMLSRADMPVLWPFLFFPCMFLPLLQIGLLFFCVESPRWLMLNKQDETGAIHALEKLRGSQVPHDVIAAEIAELRLDAEVTAAAPKLSMGQQIAGAFSWPLFVCVMMQLTQQLSGINAAIFYSSKIFQAAGLEGDAPQYASLGVVGTTAVMTLVSAALIERLGRRSLMLIGVGGMWLSCALVSNFMILSSVYPTTPAYNYVTILTLILYVATFAIGPGPIPWFIAPELSLPQYRGVAISVCTFVNWVANLAIGFGFPPLQNAIGPYSFLPFFGLLSVFLIFTFFYLPETRGKTPEESIHQLQIRRVQVNLCQGS